MVADDFPLLRRSQLRIQGMVQGVGFRPFAYKLARDLGLNGWVKNDDRGVEIEIEGTEKRIVEFLDRLQRDLPPQAIINTLEQNWLEPCGYQDFQIDCSTSKSTEGSKIAWILPDLATCPDCLREIFDKSDRRYGYPFTNCTHCGSRYSILKDLPYDRPNTTMHSFVMCYACQQEYNDPANRRFHAQPNACPDCGPQLQLWDENGCAINPDASSLELIALVADRLRQGDIVALKGLGGFHLMVNATNESAVRKLRDRKHRPAKPLAVMYPSLAVLSEDCLLSSAEAELLTSSAAPIVLLNRKNNPKTQLALSLTPGQSTLGVMLPYTPLHHLLLAEFGSPVVATSGNRSQEPICIDEKEALTQLGGIADIFLVHDRPILRPVDDSVARLAGDKPVLLRRSRGYAPFPLASDLGESMPCILAVGGHFKNTVALSVRGQILVSQHIGDLDEAQTYNRFQLTISQLLHTYQVQPVAIACDAHPDYASTRFAKEFAQRLQIPLIPVQHHYAHILAAIADNNLYQLILKESSPPSLCPSATILGVAWDGTGYGLDGTIWGGEFLAVNSTGFDRIAHLRTFPLPGGDRAAREPRRAALGLLYAAFQDAAFELDCPTITAFTPQELKFIQHMLQKGVNCPQTSSIGRLFDAIASLTGLCQSASFEGEAAMYLESALSNWETAASYPFKLVNNEKGTLVLDFEPTLSAILGEIKEPVGAIAAKFHNTLVEAISEVAHRMGLQQVVLTGGCFQNRYLLEKAVTRLQNESLRVYLHRQIPSNDGAIAAGQILAAWSLQ